MKNTQKRIFLLLGILFTYIFSGAAPVDINNSPYDVVYNHLHYMNKNSYDELKAAASFNISNKKSRIEAAIMLKEILDAKIQSRDILSKISDDPDYVDTTTHKHIYVLFDKLPQVYVEKVGDEWFYSNVTVNALPELHKKIFPFGTNFWAKWFPFQQNKEIMRLHLWQWIGIGIIISGFLLSFFLFKYFFRFIFYKFLFKKYVSENQDLDKLKLASNFFAIWIGFKLLQILIPTLFINPNYSIPVMRGVDFVTASIMVLIVYKLVELFIFYVQEYTQKTETLWDDQIVVVLQKFMKMIVVFLGLFFVLNTLDVNIATIIAGLSVGGLALALAAQDTVKNFIASVMIFIDKPFKIGDTIKGDNFEGNVLEVGFRSTRIKTANDSVIYIANAKLAEMTIDNKGFRMFKKFKAEISISYNTPLFKVKLFIEGIKNIVLKYPYTKNSSVDVFLSNMQNTGIVISINFTYKMYNQREEYQHREFILLKILDLADLMQIKIFEQQQALINPQAKIENNESVDDITTKLNNFFVVLDTQISKIK